MSDRDGFEIRGQFYPWPQQIRLLDPLLIRDVTGMEYQDFLQAWQHTLGTLEEDDAVAEVDPIVLNGLVAVGFWQQHKDWSRQRVVRYLEQLNQEELEIVGGEDDLELPPAQSESDTAPTNGAPTETTSGSTSPSHTTSNGTQASRLDQAILRSTGPRT